ncbi:uncharacterized protein LOC122315422 [Carya illinoinensis]|uniref:uncharacterized protein LOC122315422 n=1 Tax=Carya illinoinensis TaxID=32201 RepID=UPI001C721524|nr:uncharacterized protein LOC122315422 [Carya illinoinensis]
MRVGVTNWPESSRPAGCGARGWATPNTPVSPISSTRLPHGKPSCGPTSPILGLISISNSGFERSSSTRLASLSSSLSLASSSIAVSKLNPSYLRLRGDDVYFTLENSAQDWVQQREGGVLSNTASSKVYSSSLVDVERDYLSIDKRYPRLFVSPEFSKVL